MRFCALSLLTAALAAHAFAQDAPDPGKTMMVVNGQKITAGSYVTKMENLSGVGRMVGSKFVPASPGFLALVQMIDDLLMVQLAKEKGVAPTEQEVDAELKSETGDNPETMSNLRSLGYTDADIRQSVVVTLSEFKVTTIGINIANQEVDQFYQDHPTFYTTPKRYKVRVVVVKDEESTRTVDAEIQKGTPFADIAKKYSIESSKDNGGLFGDIPEDAVQPKLKEELDKIKKGETTPWADSQGNYWKFLLDDVTDAKLLPLDDNLRKSIRRGMMIDRGRVKNNVPEMMGEMRKKVKFEFQGTPFDKQIASFYKVG